MDHAMAQQQRPALGGEPRREVCPGILRRFHDSGSVLFIDEEDTVGFEVKVAFALLQIQGHQLLAFADREAAWFRPFPVNTGIRGEGDASALGRELCAESVEAAQRFAIVSEPAKLEAREINFINPVNM